MKRNFTKTITFHAPLTSISTTWLGENRSAPSTGSRPQPSQPSQPGDVSANSYATVAADTAAALRANTATDASGAGAAAPQPAATPQPPQPPPPPQPDLSALLSELTSGIEALNDARAKNVEELREIAIELSVAIASHVVREKLDADEMDISSLVAAAIEKLIPCESIQVRLHPQDLNAVQAVLTDGYKGSVGLLDFQADPEMPRGSCFVSGDGHGLVSTLDDRLENIRETLLQGIEHARIERRKADGFGAQLRRFPDRRKFA